MGWEEIMAVSRDVEYQEVLNSMRHFGITRFHLMTVFYVVTGGLYCGLQLTKAEDMAEKVLICTFGFVLAITFLLFELIINRYITNAANHALSIEPSSHLSTRSRASVRILVPTLICFVYILVAVFWIGKGSLNPANVIQSVKAFVLR
jgi:hypothetical protein